MSEEEIKQMKKVLKQQWGDTDNLVNDALCYINKLEKENENRISESLAYDLAKARVQELEHIIKEVRKYIEEDYDRNQEVVDYCNFKEFYKHILEILDKEKE